MAKIDAPEEHSHETARQDRDRHVPRTRKCLTCSTPFESAWSGERICKRCKGTSAWKSGIGTYSSD